jgi:hypothetical protein
MFFALQGVADAVVASHQHAEAFSAHSSQSECCLHE